MIGATTTVGVFDNTDTEPGVDTDTPIYMVNGTLFAPNLATFWSGVAPVTDVNKTLNITELGDPVGGTSYIHTGLAPDASTVAGFELDSGGNIAHGGMDTGYNPWFGNDDTWGEGFGATSLFAISGVIAATDPDDTDGDGLADLWEDQHFGDNEGTPTPAELAVSDGSGDSDGDGSSDFAEFRLGLIPSDPNSTFTLDASPGPAGTVALSWPSQDGLHFEIYYSDDLNLPLASWNVIQVTDDDGDGSPRHEWTDAEAASHPRRFYLVQLLP